LPHRIGALRKQSDVAKKGQRPGNEVISWSWKTNRRTSLPAFADHRLYAVSHYLADALWLNTSNTFQISKFLALSVPVIESQPYKMTA
jgi:hypothetical protein